jgi:hypothetical protein
MRLVVEAEENQCLRGSFTAAGVSYTQTRTGEPQVIQRIHTGAYAARHENSAATEIHIGK